MNARNGKIARLPRFVRDELNERLECSEPSPQLLDWLNALPEVKKVLKSDFAAVPISKQNLSEWRQGGFEEWLARRDLCEEARDLPLLADDMVGEYAEGVLADDVATVLAARFGSLIARWDGEVDGKFEAKTRVLNRLCRSVVQLQRGMHRAKREALEVQRLLEEKEKAEKEELKSRLVTPWFDALRLPAMAKMFGGGTMGTKIAEYIMAVQRGKLDAQLDLLPTDKYENEEPAVKEAESVKPTPKCRTAQRARKTEPDNAAKPLQENEIAGAKEGEFSQDQSKSVKVNQTDLAPADDEGLGVRLGLGTDEAKASLEENMDAKKLRQVTELAEKGDACGEIT
jgi:hypothetical protein